MLWQVNYSLMQANTMQWSYNMYNTEVEFAVSQFHVSK